MNYKLRLEIIFTELMTPRENIIASVLVQVKQKNSLLTSPT